MSAYERITMSLREVDRLKVIQAVTEGFLTPTRAAQRLQLSSRQVHRLVQRYRDAGVSGLTSRKRGQPSNHQLRPGLEQRAAALIRQHYQDFGPTLAAEKLVECHGLRLAKETVRRIMMDAGLWTPRRQRLPKVYQPRNRRACLGELIQIDGSDHRWFEDRAPACTLLVYIDDATSRLMHLAFTRSESTFSYFQATRAYLEHHGKPLALYSDKASVFRVNSKDAQGGDGHTQFARAMFELNIDTFCANSSQAKGRVERAHLTLQDRLVKELRLRNISTVDAANAYLPLFMADYNRRFGKIARSDFDAHRPVRDDEDLSLTFTWRESRRVSKSLTLQYDRRLYVLHDTLQARALAGRYAEIYHYPDGRIEVRSAGILFSYETLDQLPEVSQGTIVENKRLGHVLQAAQRMQEQRDSRRSQAVPGNPKPTKAQRQEPPKKKAKDFTPEDIVAALDKRRSPKRSRHASVNQR